MFRKLKKVCLFHRSEKFYGLLINVKTELAKSWNILPTSQDQTEKLHGVKTQPSEQGEISAAQCSGSNCTAHWSRNRNNYTSVMPTQMQMSCELNWAQLSKSTWIYCKKFKIWEISLEFISNIGYGIFSSEMSKTILGQCKFRWLSRSWGTYQSVHN